MRDAPLFCYSQKNEVKMKIIVRKFAYNKINAYICNVIKTKRFF